MKYLIYSFFVATLLLLGCAESVEDVSGVYETKEIKTPIKGSGSWHHSSKWILDLSESGKFTLKEDQFRLPTRDKMYSPVPEDGEEHTGEWSMQRGSVQLKWIYADFRLRKKTVEDMSLKRAWTNNEGRSVRARLLKIHPQSKYYPWRIELIRESNGHRFYMEKSDFHPSEWVKWKDYSIALTDHDGQLSWHEPYYVNVEMVSTLNVEPNGDLVCLYAGDAAKDLGQFGDRQWFSVSSIENQRFAHTE